jgi:ArsR family transcriptional regulator, arsenate/arsenite/antimonite-responsive transcriptional repressor|tara:strand:- start:2057 stop:2377 length:321 start_codon:yes stop_codon:yes gene_type:complete
VDNRRLTKAFKALSHPNRLQIYQEILRRRSMPSRNLAGCALTDFINALNVGAPTVSHHIKELVNADLISVERQGKYVTCFLNEAMCEDLQRFFLSKSPVDASEVNQ